MSTPPSRSGPPRAPERGSFPLDHFGECKALAQAYKRCLDEHKHVSIDCRHLAKEYLKCRMDTGLMATETWEHLGFHEGDAERNSSYHDTEPRKEATGYVAGLQRARGRRKASSPASADSAL